MPRYIAENDVYNLFDARGVAQLHVGDIDVLPRADVVEVVHGWWIPLYKVNWWMGTQDIDGFTCNQCARHFKSKLRLNYCPNCGAKMDLEE
jgi:hypothetical protein